MGVRESERNKVKFQFKVLSLEDGRGKETHLTEVETGSSHG